VVDFNHLLGKRISMHITENSFSWIYPFHTFFFRKAGMRNFRAGGVFYVMYLAERERKNEESKSTPDEEGERR
jgi:hypothetical protein